MLTDKNYEQESRSPFDLVIACHIKYTDNARPRAIASRFIPITIKAITKARNANCIIGFFL